MQIPNGFDEFFCLRSNLSNDNIISAQSPGLKTGVEDNIFGLKWGENRTAHPHQELPGVHPARGPFSTPSGVNSCGQTRLEQVNLSTGCHWAEVTFSRQYISRKGEPLPTGSDAPL